MYDKTSALQLWTSEANMAIYRGADCEPMRSCAVLNDKFSKAGMGNFVTDLRTEQTHRPGFDNDMQGFHVLLDRVWDKFWAVCAPENGGSVTCE